MKLTTENAISIYTEIYGNKLSPACYQLFCTLCLKSWGHYKQEPRPLSLADIKEMVYFSVPTITSSVKSLETEGLIEITRGYGKGKKNVYEINIGKLKSLCKDSLYKDSLSKDFLLDTVLKSDKISKRSVVESPQETPAALPSASLPAVKTRRSSKPKKTEREHQAFDAVYEVFKQKRGPFEPGLVKREMTHIWQLISKAQAVDPFDWEGLLTRMLAEFWRIKTSGRKQDEFLAKQPFLPSALNSSGIWPRVLDNLKSTESKKPTEEDHRLLDMAITALRS